MLLDSNLLVYAARPEHGRLRDWIARDVPAVSVVTRIEVLGYHRLQDAERILLEVLFRALDVLPLTDPIVEESIGLRCRHNMSLGDAIIAATALVHDLELHTHNTRDFRSIDRLKVRDPLEDLR